MNDRGQSLVDRIDDEFGIDICMYQNSELKRLRDALTKFLDLGVETDDLIPASEMMIDDKEEELI